jgi:Rad3-related DNA helicase
VGELKDAEWELRRAWEGGDHEALERLIGVAFARGKVAEAVDLRRRNVSVVVGVCFALL